MENLDSTQICKARYHAADMAESLNVAYWMQDSERAWHLERAKESLVALLDVINSAKGN